MSFFNHGWKNCPERIWVDKGTEFAGEFKKICNARGTQIYSTRSDTMAGFAERTNWSIESFLCRYKEDNGCKYIHKLTQFVTTLKSRKRFSIPLNPKDVKQSHFLSVFCSKPLREYRKPKIENGGKVCISKCDLTFRRSYESQFTQNVFGIDAIASRKPPTYTIKDLSGCDYAWQILSKTVL